MGSGKNLRLIYYRTLCDRYEKLETTGLEMKKPIYNNVLLEEFRLNMNKR